MNKHSKSKNKWVIKQVNPKRPLSLNDVMERGKYGMIQEFSSLKIESIEYQVSFYSKPYKHTITEVVLNVLVLDEGHYHVYAMTCFTDFSSRFDALENMLQLILKDLTGDKKLQDIYLQGRQKCILNQF